MQVELKWVDGLMFVCSSGTGHSLVVDGDIEVGGTDSAPRPTELLLMALGGCTAMDVISILRKKRQKVTGFEVKVTGQRADSHPKRFEKMQIEYIIKGDDIKEEAVKRAVELSMQKYCSVKATLEPSVEISYSYRIEPQEKGED
ncbi:MAG: OsmC family protein [Nitrospirae bacterium]|nr:MAG: OsmC family protein [Nitrospirota bacterium]